MASQKEILETYFKFGPPAGGTNTAAANHLKIPRSTFLSALQKALNEASQEADSHKADIDDKKGLGWIEYRGLEIPPLEELLKAYNLDPACWICTRVKPKTYQGFYRKRAEWKSPEKGSVGESIREHEVVTMYSVTFHIERVVSNAVQMANAEMASRIKPLPKPPRLKRKTTTEPQMAVLGIWDAHVGSLCWEGETDQNNDSPMALKRVKDAFDDMIQEMKLYPITKVIFPFGNDFMHMDNPRGETTSGNVIVDFDTRYGKVLRYCHEAVFHMIDRCRELCDDVQVVLVGGNHDRTTSLHIAHCIDQRYRFDSAVKVDLTEHARKYVRWHDVLLMFTHGDRFNPKEAYRHMTEEAREHISSVKCRECHFGDKHHREEMDSRAIGTYGKVTTRRHPSISPRDEWTFREGFDAVRAADAHRYGTDRWLSAHAAYARV